MFNFDVVHLSSACWVILLSDSCIHYMVVQHIMTSNMLRAIHDDVRGHAWSTLIICCACDVSARCFNLMLWSASVLIVCPCPNVAFLSLKRVPGSPEPKMLSRLIGPTSQNRLFLEACFFPETATFPEYAPNSFFPGLLAMDFGPPQYNHVVVL